MARVEQNNSHKRHPKWLFTTSDPRRGSSKSSGADSSSKPRQMGTRCSSWRRRRRLACGLLVCIHTLLRVSSVSAQACEGNPPAVDNNAWNCEGTGSGALCQGKCHAGALHSRHIKVFLCLASCWTLHACLRLPALGGRLRGSQTLWGTLARRSVCVVCAAVRLTAPFLTHHTVTSMHRTVSSNTTRSRWGRSGRRESRWGVTGSGCGGVSALQSL